MISIHAPARGATGLRMTYDKHMDISIHAPARGATSCAAGGAQTMSYFNPRSRKGSDP